MDDNEESMGDSSEEEIKEIPLKQLVAQNKNASKRARQQESDSNDEDDEFSEEESKNHGSGKRRQVELSEDD